MTILDKWFNGLVVKPNKGNFMNFIKVKKVNISEQIAMSLRELILGGEIKPSEKLPAERDLARRFGTNRNTLREALKILERDGLIKIKQGGGVEVNDFKKDGKINLLSAIIKNTRDYTVKINIVLDALRVRSAGLAEIARIAAEKCNKSQLAEIENALNEIKNYIDTVDHGKAYELEMKFLKSIVEAGDSMVLIWFFNTIKEITDDAFEEFGTFWNISKEYFSSINRIYEAIRDKNPALAYSVTKEHFDSLDKGLIKIFKEVKNAKV